jgi:hypothetical protein
MSRTLRRFMPVAALCLATLLGGCVVVPERHAYYAPGRFDRDSNRPANAAILLSRWT